MLYHFENFKPQSNHSEFYKDFCAGYDSTVEKLESSSLDSVRDEVMSAHPRGEKPSSMAAYFYAKGEFAALLDAQ